MVAIRSVSATPFCGAQAGTALRPRAQWSTPIPPLPDRPAGQSHRLELDRLVLDGLLVQQVHHLQLLLADDAGILESWPRDLRAKHILVRERALLDPACRMQPVRRVRGELTTAQGISGRVRSGSTHSRSTASSGLGVQTRRPASCSSAPAPAHVQAIEGQLRRAHLDQSPPHAAPTPGCHLAHAQLCREGNI